MHERAQLYRLKTLRAFCFFFVLLCCFILFVVVFVCFAIQFNSNLSIARSIRYGFAERVTLNGSECDQVLQ